MKRFFVLVVLVALASSATPSNAPAQVTLRAPLTESDVRRLIASGEPADHARLNAHFAAMAERYAADAARHEAMGNAFAGNTKLAHLATSQREHCRQLTVRNRESSAILQGLAKHHAALATGVASEPPKGSERFEGAAGGRVPSDAELNRLAATAETPADHRALAGYFTTLAARYEREAKESAGYAAAWRALTARNPSASETAATWDRLARQLRDAAQEAVSTADMHQAHAKTVK